MKNIEELKSISIDVYNFIVNNDMKSLYLGRHQINAKVYANVETYSTKDIKEGKFESHKKYIDIQYIISGEENIISEDISSLTVSEEYDETRDIVFYKDNGLGKDNILRSGEFIVLYPNDGHMPCISVNKDIPSSNKKIVFKVPIGD